MRRGLLGEGFVVFAFHSIFGADGYYQSLLGTASVEDDMPNGQVVKAVSLEAFRATQSDLGEIRRPLTSTWIDHSPVQGHALRLVYCAGEAQGKRNVLATTALPNASSHSDE